MKGLKYVLRLLRGESPVSVIKSMPEDDLNRLKEFGRGIDKSGLNRARRRELEKRLARLKL